MLTIPGMSSVKESKCTSTFQIRYWCPLCVATGMDECVMSQQCVSAFGVFALITDRVVPPGAKEMNLAATVEHLRDQRPHIVKTKVILLPFYVASLGVLYLEL